MFCPKYVQYHKQIAKSNYKSHSHIVSIAFFITALYIEICVISLNTYAKKILFV